MRVIILLSKAAKIVREDIFNMHGFHINGSFPPGFQQESVPTNLKYLESMLLNGPNLIDQDSTDSQTCLTISQTIVFNCKKSTVANKSRHSLDYKPPLPLYIGMNVHTQTRSMKLITQLCQMGLSMSYDRILQLENQLATSVCEFTKEIGFVCLIQLFHGFLPLVLWITWIIIPPALPQRIPSMAQALVYSNYPLCQMKGINRASLHYPQLTQQKIISYLRSIQQYQQLYSTKIILLSPKLLIIPAQSLDTWKKQR